MLRLWFLDFFLIILDDILIIINHGNLCFQISHIISDPMTPLGNNWRNNFHYICKVHFLPSLRYIFADYELVVCIIWSTYYDQTHWVVCLLLQTLWIQRFIGAAKNLLFNGGYLKPIPPTHSTIWHYWQIASVIWYILVLVCREIWLSQYYYYKDQGGGVS